MSAFLGINVLEVDGRVAPSIQGAATSVAAFVIRSARGVDKAVRSITSMAQFHEHFGGFREDANGAHVVKGFFDNGGTSAYVTRVVRAGDLAATCVFKDKEGEVLLTVSAAYRGLPDPGAWGNRLRIKVVEKKVDPKKEDSKKRITLIVSMLDDQNNSVDLEEWEGFSLVAADINEGARDFASIADPYSGSKYITVVVGSNAKVNPLPTGAVALAGGTDVSAAMTPEEWAVLVAGEATNPFKRFDTFDIQLLACPETDADEVANAALTYCSNRGDCMFIGHVPDGRELRDTRSAYETSSVRGADRKFSYGALYYPFIRVTAPNSQGYKWIPPTGHVMGVYARTDRERGVWKAPAGSAASVNGALDCKYSMTDVDHTSLVKQASVNAVRFIPGQGIVVDSSRTLCTNPLWLYVNVRLLFNLVKSSLKQGLRWAYQEPNDSALWNKLKYNTVTPFLMGLWRKGAFGAGDAKDVFTVVIDKTNNSTEEIQTGKLNVDVYFYPSRPAETIVIKVGQQPGGPSASEG